MNVAGKVVVVTGGANGIGKGLCERFHAEGARKVVVVDLEEDNARQVADSISGDAYGVNVRDEQSISEMVARVEADHGRIDLFCSNAGIGAGDGEPWWATSASNDIWIATRETMEEEDGTPTPFGGVENLEDLNTEHAEGGAVLSPDGSLVVFHSDRPEGIGGRDLYVALRDDPVEYFFDEPVNFVQVNTEFDEFTARRIAKHAS